MFTVKKIIKKFIKLFISEKTYMNLQRSFRVKIGKNSSPLSKLVFNVHLVEQCNLNCKSCSVFSPIAQDKFLDPACFERDIERISQLTKNLDAISLLGGEPLLHPQLDVFFGIVRKYFSDCRLMLTTNGILLPKQSEVFWRSCKENNVVIIISQYPIKLDIEKIRQQAQKYHVAVEYPPRDAFFKIPFDVNGKQNADYNFRKCFLANYCIELLDGKLYPCCFPGHIKEFNHTFNQNIEVTENDGIDIYKAMNIDEILRFLCKPIPFCRFCNLDKTQKDIGWGISKKEISEWT
jgi:uncharacterized radical SAM superfamily Fe-S cluster-containing enzyme